MSAMKIKKGDTVQVITGTDKGKEGKVVSVDAKNNKVVVEGVYLVSKHTKPNAQNQIGVIVRLVAPMNVSNVMYVHKGKATKIGYKLENGKKSRVAKSTGEVID